MNNNYKKSFSLPNCFNKYNQQIDEGLKKELQYRKNPIYTTHEYYMGWNSLGGKYGKHVGKRFRPTLLLLSSDCVNGNTNIAINLATALEYIHNFSLIHDDLEDRDKFRHHRPTVWAIWGDSKAIISGNGMLKISDEIMGKISSYEISKEFAIKLQKEITLSYLKMMEGQYLDIAYENTQTVSIDQYLKMIELKTGALIESAMYLGSMTNFKQTQSKISKYMRMIGHEIGRIYQIRDDILGVWGTSKTGKPVGADLFRKKKSLPAVHALNTEYPKIRNKMNSLFSSEKINQSKVNNILEIMEELDTCKFCQSMAESHWYKAKEIISSLDLNDNSKRDLEELGEFLLYRES